MALAAGEPVLFNVRCGLPAAYTLAQMTDPPLVGAIKFTGGDAPDEVGINWENAPDATMSAAEAALVLTETDPDPNYRLIAGMYARVTLTPKLSGKIIESWIADPDGAALRTILFETCDGKYVVASFVQCTIQAAAFVAGPC